MNSFIKSVWVFVHRQLQFVGQIGQKTPRRHKCVSHVAQHWAIVLDDLMYDIRQQGQTQRPSSGACRCA